MKVSNLDGDWQKVLFFNLQSYGDERILIFQKVKLKEVAMKLTNPFIHQYVQPCLSKNPNLKYTFYYKLSN